MPSVRLPDGRIVHFPADMAPQEIESEVSKLVGPSTKPAKRTWGDTLTDALPLAGGIVGGVAGAAGGIPGIMAGSAVGGGFGEAARQRLTQDDYDFGDIAATGLAEGATAGAFGAAGKIGGRIIRGVRRANITPTDVVKGAASSLVSKEMPIIGAVRSGIERASESRMAREALGSGRLNTSRVEKLDDILTQALEEARGPITPSRVGGSGSPLRAKNNLPVVNPERSHGMISTQPDKWGTSSIHRADDFVDRSRLVDKARPVVDAPAAVAPTTRATMADDAFSRYTRGNPQQQELLQALLKAERASAAPPVSEHLTKAGRSMMTDEDTLLLEKALRDMRTNLASVPRSRAFGR